jgi:hypothetical protein
MPSDDSPYIDKANRIRIRHQSNNIDEDNYKTGWWEKSPTKHTKLEGKRLDLGIL